MKPVSFIIVLAVALFGAAACGGGGREASADGSPGVRSTAYLPPSPNEASTGTNSMNSSFAVLGGQTTDASNPLPAGLPAASPALN